MPPTSVQRIRTRLISRGGGFLVTSILRSTRMEIVHGAEWEREIVQAGVPAIYVCWHGRLLPCAYRYRHCGFATLITRNRDGDYITDMIERWGYRVVRGSSSRGGSSALREFIRLLRAGQSVAITPDGPRGPRQKMKLGPVQAARAAGVPIVPVTASAEAGWYFGGWDRFLVPRPFTRIAFAIGEPLVVPPGAGPEAMDAAAATLEDRLNEITRIVDEAAGASVA